MSRASRALLLAGLLCSLGGAAVGQVFQGPDWKESDTPPAPAFDLRRLVPIEVPAYMTLKFGVDPATIVITGDGLVRYVVVGTNKAGNAVNAFYEGVRCATGEMKSYARSSGNGWETVANPEWRPMVLMNSNYTHALAVQGLCRSGAPRASVGEMVRRLKNPVQELE
ncbi:CNP1-like family protein [Variovorax sp. LT1R16]|uniref:CNP1-like family protein n=1 Tax=Variovorax sp. LT1R16 TaxID=3443728 RepID=UPI003F4755F3